MNASTGNSSSHGKPLKCNQNVQVYLRVRPTNVREKLIRSQDVIEVVSNREVLLKPMILDTRNAKKFTFDRAFDVNSKQHEVYNAVVAPYIEEVLAGFNCTVFAYGQTGTGKTYTMVGEEKPELSAGWDDDTETGMIPRALNHLFDELRMTELEFSMRISYLELYNEELCDLLSNDDTVKIRIYDDVNKKGSVIVQGLEEIPVHSKDDVYKLLAKGQERRRTASTLMNAQSSRSHTIFSIIVHIKENGIEGEELLKIGKLNLVDLAGSENITKAGNEKGIRTRETVNINQSLLTLGRVITALVERTPHVPYRESKLTRLLQESLGGRTKTSIIATISPGHKDFEETMSTLEYAHRAKNIQNKPEANQKLSKKTVIKEYTEEIDRLKRELTATRDKNGIYLPEETYNEMCYKADATTKELNDKVVLIKVLKDDLAKKEAIFKEVSLNLVEREEMLRKTEDDLCVTKHELSSTKRTLSKTKQRYAEKKVILERHVKTEKMLTGQAKELIEVVETVQSDTNGLHDTIDRRKETDVKNQTACQQFVEQIKNRVQMLQTDAAYLTQTSNQINNALADDWETYMKRQERFQQDAQAKLSALEGFSQNMLSRESAMLTTFRADQTNCNVEQIRKVETYTEGVNRAVENLLTTLTANVQSLKRTLVKQEEEYRKQHESVLQICRRNDERNLRFCATQQEVLKEIDGLMDQFFESQTPFDEYVETSEMFEGQLNQLFENMKAVMKEKRDRLKATRQDMEAGKKSFKSTIAGNADAIGRNLGSQQEESKQLELDVRQLDTMRQESKSVIEGRLQNQIIQPVETVAMQLKETVPQQKQLFEAFEEISRVRWEDYAVQHEHNLVDYSNGHAAQTQALQQELNSNYSAQSEFRNTAVSLNKQLQSNIASHQHTSDCNLMELCDQVDRFHRQELTLYQPTGQTPVRKTISYPKDLAMTSPHDRIVRRFWRERGMLDLDVSDIINEDNENVSMLCNSLDTAEIRNSTPLAMRHNGLDEDQKRFKDLQLSTILAKVCLKEVSGSILYFIYTSDISPLPDGCVLFQCADDPAIMYAGRVVRAPTCKLQRVMGKRPFEMIRAARGLDLRDGGLMSKFFEDTCVSHFSRNASCTL
ncbi:kinesin-like protein Klp61F [Sabethes cyaneus]|uniref:kinesin-like protein Klp61F n=1 Tax=Sabethes cyaneus TaxID=53552 RepID=UPI00237D7E05|nr:kinesin-like protein Klp61F [Sabethes cyaneus]